MRLLLGPFARPSLLRIDSLTGARPPLFLFFLGFGQLSSPTRQVRFPGFSPFGCFEGVELDCDFFFFFPPLLLMDRWLPLQLFLFGLLVQFSYSFRIFSGLLLLVSGPLAKLGPPFIGLARFTAKFSPPPASVSFDAVLKTLIGGKWVCLLRLQLQFLL